MHDVTIKQAKPGDTLRDDQVKGLLLRAFAGRKSFYLYFRTKLGQERKPKIGDYPTISLAKARELAREMLVTVAEGKDPVVERARLKHAPTAAELFDQFVKERGNKKTADEDVRMWHKYLAPKLGKMKVTAVEYEDVRRIHESMKPVPYQANRALALASAMFNVAEKHKFRPHGSNPCQHVARFTEMKRKRHMTAAEAALIASLLRREKDAYPESVAFIYLLIMTGARKSEIAKATKSQVIGNKIVLTVHKTDGAGEVRTIFLAPQVVELLAKLTENKKAGDTITGIESPKRFWDRIRKEAGCPDLRMHDLRRSFASVALKAGLTLDQIGEMLGHSSTQTTKGYAWLMEEAGHASATVTADAMEKLMSI